MAKRYVAAITIGYEDYTDYTYKINLAAEYFAAFNQIQTRAKAFNADIPESVRQTFVNEDGESISAITGITLVETDSEVVYGHE